MKKILASLLALLTVLSMAACASDAATTSDTTASDVADVETTAAETTVASEYVDPGVDFGGAEFYIASYDSDNVFWQAATYCDAYVEEENGDPINDSVYRRNAAVEDELNVKLICRGFNDGSSGRNIANKVKPLILAGDDKLDMMYITGDGLSSLLGTGNIIDLASIPTLDLSHSWWDEESVTSLSLLGSSYAVTGDASLYANFAPVIYFMNKQVAEDYSLGNLYDVVRDGSWTVDTALEKVRAVTADVNGDGVRGVEDVYGLCGAPSMIMYAFDSSDIRLTKNDADGVPEPILNNAKTVGLIEKLVPFYLDREYVTLATDYSGYGNVYTDVFVPMFAENRVLFYNNQLLVAMNLRNMESDFGVLPNPKYDEAQDGYISTQSNSWASFVTVPTTVRDLNMTGYILDALGYYGQQYVTPAYIDTTVMDKALRDDDSAEMLEIILGSRHYEIAYYYNWGGIGSLVTAMVTGGTTDFASKYAAIEDTVAAKITETIELVKANK